MILVALLALGLVVVKTTVLESIRIGGILPDPFLALVVYASLFRGPLGGLVSGAAVGVVVELASTEGRGIYPALYGVIGWLAGVAWERVIRRSATSEFLFLAGLGFVVDLFLLVRDGGVGAGLPIALLTVVIPSAIATGLAGPIAFAAAGRQFLPLHAGSSPRVRGRRR